MIVVRSFLVIFFLSTIFFKAWASPTSLYFDAVEATRTKSLIPPNEKSCEEIIMDEEILWKNRIRVNLLNNLDYFLNLTLNAKSRNYPTTLFKQSFQVNVPEIRRFVCLHGFFSPVLPLVGKISSLSKGLPATRALLMDIQEKISDRQLKKFATAEALAKVVAYRDLRKGDVIAFYCDEQDKVIDYRVDEVFNLWHGMPAFGLVSDGPESSLLLFRGTDFSIDSERGWASVLSDIDLKGVGMTAFEKARPEIHRWLKKVAAVNKRARAIGFSLGGALAAYTYILENSLMSTEPSYAFNPPGVPNTLYAKWGKLLPHEKENLVTFVNRGDIVSRVGKLVGRAYELTTGAAMKPLTAHTVLWSGEKTFYQIGIDLERENQRNTIYQK